VAEAFTQAGFEGVVARVCDAGDLTYGTINAGRRRLSQRTAGIEPPLIDIVFGGERVAARIKTGVIDGGVGLNESRQFDAGGSHVADLE